MTRPVFLCTHTRYSSIGSRHCQEWKWRDTFQVMAVIGWAKMRRQ
ncbi:MAG: hypothetical protein ACAI43_26700 [Phycisphaerae bacterium]